MSIKFTNNATATLAASISTSSTSLTVTTGQGALFPTLAAGDYFYATLVDSSNNIEIVKITARSRSPDIPPHLLPGGWRPWSIGPQN